MKRTIHNGCRAYEDDLNGQTMLIFMDTGGCWRIRYKGGFGPDWGGPYRTLKDARNALWKAYK